MYLAALYILIFTIYNASYIVSNGYDYLASIKIKPSLYPNRIRRALTN